MRRDWLIRTHGVLIGTLLVYALGMRLLPWVLRNWGVPVDQGVTVYPWNFSPLPALFLFGAACFRDLRWAFLLPLGACVLGDLGIWALSGEADFVFYRGAALVYACHALTISLGLWLRRCRRATTLAGFGLLAGFFTEAVFFMVTNFGVWYFGDGKLYPQTSEGLWACYIAALPYFRNSLISMTLFGSLLFGPVLWVLAVRPSQSALAAE